MKFWLSYTVYIQKFLPVWFLPRKCSFLTFDKGNRLAEISSVSTKCHIYTHIAFTIYKKTVHSSEIRCVKRSFSVVKTKQPSGQPNCHFTILYVCLYNHRLNRFSGLDPERHFHRPGGGGHFYPLGDQT